MAPPLSSDSAQAASVAPVVTTSSTRTIQRPSRGWRVGLAPAGEAPGFRRNAPSTFVARWERSRSNWAIVALARSRIGAQGSPRSRAAARHLGLSYAMLLTRERATIAQFDLDRGDRAANVAGAFVAGHGGTQDPLGRWVLLVDDVVTTGATLAACAAPLVDAGALGVSAVSVARER